MHMLQRPHVPLLNLFSNDYWGTRMSKEQSHKSYRPLTVLTFRLNYALGGLDPSGYHLVNVVLHGAVVVLFHDLCSRLFPARSRSSQIPLLASVAFAVHPVRRRREWEAT